MKNTKKSWRLCPHDVRIVPDGDYVEISESPSRKKYVRLHWTADGTSYYFWYNRTTWYIY